MSTETKKRAGRKSKWSEEIILQAIKGSAGIKSVIMKKLDISFTTLQTYIEKYPAVKEALELEKESVLDMAEGNLYKLVQNGDLSAIFYLLNNQGRKRGYGVMKLNPNEASNDSQKEERKTGVLVTPGMLTEEAWTKEASKK